jgi:16S rRNA (guanine(966)-N(2))-methyltransferase RsmD
VIGGACKGRTLKAPAWEGLRPTSDRLRETLFNILAHRIDASRVLDVFAGTGAVGIEALSRGAAAAVFIENDRRAAALIAENAERCGVRDRCAIIRQEADRALAAYDSDDRFDVIVLDPPYDWAPARRHRVHEMGGTIARAVRLLVPGGILVLEHAWRQPPPDAVGAEKRRTVRSGDSALTFYNPAPATAQPEGQS